MIKKKAVIETLRRWTKYDSLRRKLAYVLVAIAIAAGIVTVVILTRDSGGGSDAKTIINLII